MSISAVGFLFRDNLAPSFLSEKNYTCTIHKQARDGSFKKETIISPDNKNRKTEYVSPLQMKQDVYDSVKAITDNKNEKFVGAAIKNGNAETEIHSLLSDKLFVIRTKDENGKNGFKIAGQKGTQNLLARNIYLQA